jgi:tetratricopeptide (TPR) repeat protein
MSQLCRTLIPPAAERAPDLRCATAHTQRNWSNAVLLNHINRSFLGWLYRPYIDLGDRQCDGNYQVLGLDLAARGLLEADDGYARVHVGLHPSARRAIVRGAGLPDYLVEDPRALPEKFRRPAWQALCTHLGSYGKLDAKAQMRTLWLLHQLTMHALLLQVIDEYAEARSSDALTDDRAAILTMRGIGCLNLFRDGERTLDLSDLHHVELYARPGSWAHIEATYLLAQVTIKTFADVDAFAHLLDKHRASIEAAEISEHERNKLLSRFHRILPMLAQLKGDLATMTAEMDRAQSYCDRMRNDTESTRAESQILQAGIHESRIKERLVCGDLPGALSYARQLVSRHPADPRAYLELGQVLIEMGDLEAAADAYNWAAILGPYVTEIAEFMIGQCQENLARPEVARAAYVRSLKADHLAASAVEQLSTSGLADQNPQLKGWVDSYLRELGSSVGDGEDLRAYQKYDGLLGGSPQS